MPDTIELEPFVAQDGAGVPTYGAALQIKARVEAMIGKLTNSPAEQTSPFSPIMLSPRTIFGVAYDAPTPRDRVTLPAGYSPRVPKIVSAAPVKDADGVHHHQLLALMRDSAMRRQVTVRRSLKSINPLSGQPSAVWLDVAVDVWADVIPISGQETPAGGQGGSSAERQAWTIRTFEIDFLATEAPTPEWQVVDQGRAFDVLDVKTLGQRERLLFLARARAE